MVPVTGPAAFASVITAVFTPSTIAAATAFVMASAIRSADASGLSVLSRSASMAALIAAFNADFLKRMRDLFGLHVQLATEP